MRILIIGGSSALSTALIPVLKGVAKVLTAGRNNDDIVLDLRQTNKPFSFPMGVDIVIQVAAHFGGKTSEEIIAAEEVNLLGTLRACRASVDIGAKHFIFVSSIYSQMRPDSSYYSIYALSKKHAEEATIFFCAQQGLPLTVLRPAQLYGKTSEFAKHQPFLYSMADKAQRGEDIVLNGRNDALRNLLHADDFAYTILKIVEQRITGVYPCQFPFDTSISTIAKAAIAAFGSPSKLSFLPSENDIKDNVFPIDDLLYQKIKFYPRIDIEEGMRMIARNRIQS